MVKRKKNGTGSLEDEKRNDDGISGYIMETADNAEILLEPSNCTSQQTNQPKNRIHVTRTCTKETQGTSESTEAEPSGTPPEKCQKNLPAQRSSNRAQKRIRKDINISDSTIKKAAGVTLKQNVPIGSKTRRPWELWSVEDKNSFFEALCEYGKDFENIQSYITQKSKKKGIPANMIKNKDQVRHFYYRTWHKISKYLQINDDVRKQTQEIYGLVNYAELRKKIGGCLNEKNRQKLNELVFNGVTTVKYKGKKLRIKTPVCRALKKLNNVAETKEPEIEKLPKDITVELRPHTNHAWLHVQNLAQNPRLRTKVPLQRRLKTVIEYLQQKWKPYRLRKKEQILSGLIQADDAIILDDTALLLRLKPKSDAAISTVSISTMDNASSSDVCLEKYIKVSRETLFDKEAVKAKKSRLKPKLQNESEAILKCDQLPVNKAADCLAELPAKESDQSVTEDNFNINLLTPPKSGEEADGCSENVVDEAQRSLFLLSSMLNSVEKQDSPPSPPEKEVETISEENADVAHNIPVECGTIEEICFNSYPEGETLTLGQLLSLGSNKNHPTMSENEQEKKDSGEEFSLSAQKEVLEDEPLIPVKNSDGLMDDMDSLVKNVKSGWTLNNVGLLTIGELYLMLGQPTKFVLEYDFELPVERTKALINTDEKKDTENDKSVNVDEVKGVEREKSVISDEKRLEYQSDDSAQNLTGVLKKLIQAATNTFAEFKSKQTPLSPTSRNSGHTRVSAASQLNKANPRCISKTATVKTAVKSKSSNSGTKVVLDSIPSLLVTDDLIKKDPKSVKTDVCSTTNSLSTVCSDGMPPSSEKHVFVVPVGTAPRTVKKPTQESLREEIDKLLPGTRRGCRVRRKPLVVQRPLLPRDGIGAVSGPRPMTVLHLVPSGSQLTAVIPSSCAGAENKNMLPAKKVVKILSPAPGIDVRPLQVPLMKQVNADANQNVILQPSAIPTAHLMVAPGTSQGIQNVDHQNIALTSGVDNLSNVCTIINSIDKSPVVITSTVDAQPTLSDIVSQSSSSQKQNSLSSSSEGIVRVHDKMIASSPPQISIPDQPCSSSSALSPGSVSSFIEISLAGGLSAKDITESNDSNLLDFTENSALSAFGLSSPKSSTSEQLSVLSACHSSNPIVASSENTPPQSPPSRPFRIESPGPEAQWLNGEGGEVSLNTFLNTLDSPCKVMSVSSSLNSGNENSNLDPITRLAPVVDSQVRCLLEECSVDFITKFEDLADVINSSNNDSKQT